ncbi:MAG: hypothetical protein Q7T63_06235 [Burkholderiaceae bacterium]|nr:hypothetical protein [Burkholderiaceae bacterium]
MCFSAAASFAASAVLLVLGGASMGVVRKRSELPFAAIPLIFALQQFSEGLVWLGLDHGRPGLSAAMAQVFAFFALVLWPAYVPLTVWLAEPVGRRRRALAWVAGGGAVVSAGLLLIFLAWPVTVEQRAYHLEYRSAPFLGVGATALYLGVTTLSLLMSTQPWIRRFGVLVLLAFALTAVLYAGWFVSVWCFFAAVVSSVVCLQLLARRRRERLARRVGVSVTSTMA